MQMYEPHPIALEYHPLPDDELRALGEDIRVNGLHQKILLYRENGGEPRILDGVQRMRAAVLVDMELADDDFEEYTGDDPRGVVASRNLYRRHLTVAQKKEKARAILKAQPERSDRDIAKEAGFQSHNVVSDIRAEVEAEQANGLRGHKVTVTGPGLSETLEPGQTIEIAPGDTVPGPALEDMEHPERSAQVGSGEGDEQETGLSPVSAPPPAAPRVERGVKKDGTPRAARGRKPLPAAEKQARKEAKKSEKTTKPARLMGTPREAAIAVWEPLFKADTVQCVTDLAMLYKSYEGIIQQRCSATQLNNCLQLIAKAFGRRFADP